MVVVIRLFITPPFVNSPNPAPLSSLPPPVCPQRRILPIVTVFYSTDASYLCEYCHRLAATAHCVQQ